MPINYNPTIQQTIIALQAVDATFKAGTKLADVDATARYVYRCEVPYNHHVSFDQPAIIDMLPRHLHEHRDVNKPHRLAFDVEREVTAEQFKAIMLAFPGQSAADAFATWCQTAINQIIGAIDRVLRLKYLGKFAKDAEDARKKIQAADFEPTILESCRQVSGGWLRLIVQGHQLPPPKLSYHLVYKNVWLADGQEAQEVAELVGEDLKTNGLAPLANYIDYGIYRRLYFRAYGSAKPTEPARILKQPHEEDVGYAHDEYNLQRILLPPRHVFPAKKRKEQAAPAPDNADLPAELAELLAENAEILRGFTFDQTKMAGKFIRLMGSADSFCRICGRNHRGGMQNYIMRNKAGYTFRCSHNDAKGKPTIMLRCHAIAKQYEARAPAILAGLGTFVGSQAREENTIRVNKRYLTDDLAEMYGAGTRLMLVSSAMGTGKTFGLRRLLDGVGDSTVCMLSFRKAFTREKANDLGLHSYLDIKGTITQASNEEPEHKETPTYRRVIVQVESLCRLNTQCQPDIVIIDEIESIMEQLNKTNGNIYQSSVEALKSIIAHAKCIVLMDANITTAVIDYFTRIRQDLQHRILLNEYRHEGITAKIYANESSVMDAFCAHIVDIGPACMCSDSKTLLDLTRDQLINRGIAPADIFVASSETAEERARLLDEYGNMTVVVSRYRAFLYNTTLLAGVSIEDETKRELFAIFKSDFITPTAACQLIGRVRGVQTLHLAAIGTTIVPKSRREHIGILMRNTADRLFGNDLLPRKAPPLMKLYATNSAAREFGQAALLECLVVLLARHGYAIGFIDTRGRKIIGALIKTKTAEIERIIETVKANEEITAYVGNMIGGTEHIRVLPEYRPYLTVEDIRLINNPATRLAADNLAYISRTGSVASISQRYEIAGHAGSIEDALAAMTGESHAAQLTGTAIAFLRFVGADLTGRLPLCPPIPCAEWQAKSAEFMQANGLRAANESTATRKLNKLLAATLGVRFNPSREKIRDGKKRLPAAYLLDPTGDFIWVTDGNGGRWRLALLERIDGQIKAASIVNRQ